MIEIKFRAWNFKEMIYNVSVRNSLIQNHKIKFDYLNKSNYPIMQYTGLKDKNGKEIYEGDILSKVIIGELGRNIQYFYVVIWSSSDNGYACKQYVLDENENGSYWRLKNTSSFDNLSMVTTYNHVVGNIHENPELLNK